MDCFIFGGPKNSSYFHEVKGKASPGHDERGCLIKRCTVTREVGNSSQRKGLGNNRKTGLCSTVGNTRRPGIYRHCSVHCEFPFPSSTRYPGIITEKTNSDPFSRAGVLPGDESKGELWNSGHPLHSDPADLSQAVQQERGIGPSSLQSLAENLERQESVPQT